jgi:hypothetical protein
MNIKSLLLGSAAALVAVSGARAADAVIAPEPEPVEYVRVCDVYGTSFYYIPGTEICLKVGGYMRYDIGVGDLFGDLGDFGDETYYKRARFQLRMDARTETELGTLRGYAAINFDWRTEDFAERLDFDNDGFIDNDGFGHDAVNNFGIEHAYAELGGFRIGVTDSLFSTETGYASDVVQDGLIAYGPFTTHQIAYTFDAGNGFSISAAVEEGDDGGPYTTYAEGFTTQTVGGVTVVRPFGFGDHGTVNDYTPYFVAGAAYSGGIWGASIVGAYDSNQEEFAVKGRIDLRPNDMFSLFVMGAWTDDGDCEIAFGVVTVSTQRCFGGGGNGGNYYATWGGDWAVWAGGSARFNDTFKWNVEFGYNDFGDYSIVSDVNVTVVPGFVVTPGVGYKHQDGNDNFLEGPLQEDEDNWGGYLRTQFTF